MILSSSKSESQSEYYSLMKQALSTTVTCPELCDINASSSTHLIKGELHYETGSSISKLVEVANRTLNFIIE